VRDLLPCRSRSHRECRHPERRKHEPVNCDIRFAIGTGGARSRVRQRRCAADVAAQIFGDVVPVTNGVGVCCKIEANSSVRLSRREERVWILIDRAVDDGLRELAGNAAADVECAGRKAQKSNVSVISGCSRFSNWPVNCEIEMAILRIAVAFRADGAPGVTSRTQSIVNSDRRCAAYANM
jgi:hypothetical protein